MKVRWLYSLITAIALMLMTPMAMAACGSCHDSPGDKDYQVSVNDVGSVNALDVGAGPAVAIQNSGLFQSVIAYKEQKKHEIYRKPNNDGKVIGNVLVTAYPGRNLYSGVTAA